MLVFLFAVVSFIAFQLVQLIYVVCQAIVGSWIGGTVQAIAVGFGPNLWMRKVRGIEWRIGAVPTGGYTKFFGHADDDDWPPHEPGHPPVSFHDLPVVGRMMLMLVGPLSALLIGLLLVAIPIVWQAQQVVVGSQATMAIQPSAVPELGIGDEAASWAGQRALLRDTFVEFWRRVVSLGNLREWGGFVGAMFTCAAAMVVSPLAWMSCFGVICVGMAVLNLVPIPGMNGGHILFLLIEAVFGKLPHRIGNLLTVPSLLVILAIWIYVASLDITWGVRTIFGS